MNCARCNKPIEPSQLYHEARRRDTDDQGGGIFDDIVTVHDYPCPTRWEIVNGRVLVNGVDIGAAITQYDNGVVMFQSD